MTITKKKRLRMASVIASLAAGAYLVGYLCVRQHRLSFEFMASRMAFESNEQAQKWVDEFHEGHQPPALVYDDNEALYLFFWPAIHIDSFISKRSLRSPFSMPPCATPSTQTGSQKAPPVDSLQVPPRE